MFADMDEVKEAGYNSMAMGGNTFQAGYLFHALVAAVGGPEVHEKFYRVDEDGAPDPSVFEEQGLRNAIERFRRSPIKPTRAGPIASGTRPRTR